MHRQSGIQGTRGAALPSNEHIHSPRNLVGTTPVGKKSSHGGESGQKKTSWNSRSSRGPHYGSGVIDKLFVVRFTDSVAGSNSKGRKKSRDYPRQVHANDGPTGGENHLINSKFRPPLPREEYVTPRPQLESQEGWSRQPDAKSSQETGDPGHDYNDVNSTPVESPVSPHGLSDESEEPVEGRPDVGESVTNIHGPEQDEHRNITKITPKLFRYGDQGLVICIYKGNLAALPVDVIVNDANGNLQHEAGLARAIAYAAGEELQRECEEHISRYGSVPVSRCVATTSGKLPCKVVLHAVGPMWKHMTEKDASLALQSTIHNVLDFCYSNGVSSVAIPAISAGIFGGSPRPVAEAILKGLLSGLEKAPRECVLKVIHIVDIQDPVLSTIQKAFYSESTKRNNLSFIAE